MPKFLEVTDTAAARAAIDASGQLYVNVKDYGAIGNGVADDTTAIENAYAASTSGSLYFPAGNYVYTGSGLNSAAGKRIRIRGVAPGVSAITLGASSYLIAYTALLPSLSMSSIAVYNGKGAIKHTRTATNVAGIYLIEDCLFKDYTECAIATDSSDMPFWHIKNCVFDSANTTGTIGVAMGAGNDNVVIRDCVFQKNRVHIKARRGNNLHIENCELENWSTDNSGGPRVGVWIVPSASNVNAGFGFSIIGGRFGNEALVAGDYRVVFADELSGASNGARMPNLAADSTGFIQAASITESVFVGTSGSSHPMIYSTTPNVQYCQIHHNIIYGTQPSYAIQFRTPPTTPDRLNSVNVVGPLMGNLSTESDVVFPISNAAGVAHVQDPTSQMQRSDTIRTWSNGSPSSYTQILSAATTAFTASSVTKSNITDAFGGADAVKLTMDNSFGTLSSALVVDLVIGLPLWIEFDISNPDDGSESDSVSVFLRDDPNKIHLRRCVDVPSVDQGWVTHAFCVTPRTTGQAPTRIMFGPPTAAQVGKTVNIGRVRVYQANERQLGGRRPTADAACTDVMDSADLANGLRNDLISLGVLSGTPSSGSVTGLGTPASGTLTNCTGLPVSGITASTSTALGVGSVELGHASDSTISRLSAGQLAVEGNPLATKVAVPASAGATGVVGQWAAESGWLYICVAANTWERVAIASW